MGATLSGELRTLPLPVMHVALGYRWSHNESATTPYWRQLDNDRQSFRSCLRGRKNGDNSSESLVSNCNLLFLSSRRRPLRGSALPRGLGLVGSPESGVPILWSCFRELERPLGFAVRRSGKSLKAIDFRVWFWSLGMDTQVFDFLAETPSS